MIMDFSIRSASLTIFAALFVPAGGCTMFFSLDPLLDKAIGQKTGDVRYPQLIYRKKVRDEGSRTIYEYSIDTLWRCRWQFEVEKESDVIMAWNYPDADAARRCSELPSSRP